MDQRITRRRFLELSAGAGTFALGGLAAACAPAPAPPAPKPAVPTPVSAAPSPSPVPTPRPSGSLTTVKYGLPAGVFEFVLPRAAKDAGIYSEAGLDVEFVDTPGGALVKAAISGEFLVTQAGPPEVLAAIGQGGDIVIVGVPLAKLPFVFVAQEGYNRLEDLYGKAVGTSGPGALLQIVIEELYRTKGLDPTRLNYINIGSSPQQIGALVAKKTDATALLYTDLAVLEKSGAKAVQLADIGKELPNYLRQSMIVRRASIQSNDELLRKFFIAHSKGLRWALENKEAVIQAAMNYQKRERAQAESSYEIVLRSGLITPDFAFHQNQIDYIQRLNVAQGKQKEVLPFDKVADLRYVKAVEQALGPYKPKA